MSTKSLRFNGVSFQTEPSSTFPHATTAVGSYKNSPFVTGSYMPWNKKTEILDYEAKTWVSAQDYPFSPNT